MQGGHDYNNSAESDAGVSTDKGKLGAKFGKRGGRPRCGKGTTDSMLFHGQPYGMDDGTYSEIMQFLTST